jgi:hypothetical protein
MGGQIFFRAFDRVLSAGTNSLGGAYGSDWRTGEIGFVSGESPYQICHSALFRYEDTRVKHSTPYQQTGSLGCWPFEHFRALPPA